MAEGKQSKNLCDELESRGKRLTVHNKYRINRLLSQKASLELALRANTDDAAKKMTYEEVCDELNTVSTLISRYIALIDRAIELEDTYESAKSLVGEMNVTMTDIRMIVERFTKLAECKSLLSAVALSAR